MVNILDIEPEYFFINDFKGCKDGSLLFNLWYCEENIVLHIVFDNIGCIFRKSGICSYLVFYENDKNKKIINNHLQIIDQIKGEIISWVDDEEEDDLFNLANDFMRFRFRADDNLVYNRKIIVEVCEISLSSVVKKENIYYLQFKLQKCFYERENKQNHKL